MGKARVCLKDVEAAQAAQDSEESKEKEIQGDKTGTGEQKCYSTAAGFFQLHSFRPASIAAYAKVV